MITWSVFKIDAVFHIHVDENLAKYYLMFKTSFSFVDCLSELQK